MNPRLLAAAAALALLTGCSAGTEADDPTVAVPPTAAATAPTEPTASPTPEGTVIEVTYEGGEVSGVGPRVEVPLGEQVVLRVTSDVVEEIHVHGYDVYVDLAPGTPGEVTFTADKPGAYEVELHGVGRPLFQLRVA